MEMGSELKEILKNVCFNGQWDYTVFWKIKHGAGARMVLTWEDDHYKNCSQHDPLKNKFFDETVNKLANGHYQYDSLRLAAAKMSCHVYSLGEGIIGQVAATGKHKWIFADNYMADSSSSFEYADEWRNHFSAGIKTLLFVAVVPHGVVQLGSFNKVLEDMKLVKHIREIFSTYQAPSLCQIYSPNRVNNSLHLPDLYTKVSGVGGSREMQNKFSSMLQSLDKISKSPSYAVSRPGINQRESAEPLNNHVVLDSTLPPGNEIDKLLDSKSIFGNLEHRERAHLKLLDGRERLIDASAWRDGNVGTKHFSPYMQNPYMEEALYSNAFSANSSHAAFAHISSDMFYCATDDIPTFDSVNSVQGERLPIQNHSIAQLQETEKKNLEVCSESSYTNISNTSFKFSTGFELLEALGSSFSKQSHCDWETEMAEVGTSTSSKLPEATRSSPLSSDSDNLLEAVVANIFQNRSDSKSEKSSYESVHSFVTTGITPEPDNHKKQSILPVGRSIDQSSLGQESSQHCLSSSDVGIVRFREGYSSSCPSTRSEQIEKFSEPVNINKKRAKPGENSRPRPRDRQLIQDRIKELRELVPSGSKCSIDALLERTIKHMLFLQSITKHSDKLQKCAESKLCNNESGVPGSSNFEQGSSWAVEVGSHLKVCTIIVENLNVNGQMLVEMLCEECSHFLEIAEAIRSLGLTILKGVTESHGEKTWICFVVEGQKDKSMRRMDILWSLVKIFQPETTASSHSSAALKDIAMQALL